MNIGILFIELPITNLVKQSFESILLLPKEFLKSVMNEKLLVIIVYTFGVKCKFQNMHLQLQRKIYLL